MRRLYRPAHIHPGTDGHHPARPVLLCLVAIFLLCTAAQAQLTNTGRDFFFAIPPNYHDEMFDNHDSIYIFVTAKKPTYVEVTYHRGNVRLSSYPIGFHSDSTEVRTAWALDREIYGFNNSGVISPLIDRGEQPRIETFRVTSKDADITVFVMNRSHKSSDAFVALPATALGTHYCVLSYNSNGRTNGPELDGFSTPSQFVVVATEDNTEVTILPSQPTRHNGMATQRIRLNKSQCYLVQAGLTEGQVHTDLTGTRVTSSKPVVVISGHQRATIPIGETDIFRTRNYLIEQLPPVEAWGYNALAIPYPTPLNETSAGTDLVRVLAYYDSTVVSIDGVETTVLNGGAFYEQPLQRAMRIEGSAPILVAQYKKSSRTDAEPVGSLGDPFMVIVPPEEQFMQAYRFVSPQVHTAEPEPPLMMPVIFQQQYATVVIPRSHAHTLLFDGVPVPSSQFMPVADTEWSYAHITSSDGVHDIAADTVFGLYVYGYGEADSYGYAGGMKLAVIPKDLTPPGVSAAGECELAGVVHDSAFADSGIRSVEAPEWLRFNVDVQLPIPTGFPQSAAFSARLVDPYQDGSFRLVVRDSAGLRTEQDIVLHGFTVDAAVASTGEKFVEASTRVDREVCFDLELHNYGTTTHTVSADFGNARFSVASPLPVLIAPGEKRIVQVCFESGDMGLFRDTLIIGNDCTPRSVLSFAVEAIDDTISPQFAASMDTCDLRRKGAVTDQLPGDWGLHSVRVERTSNAVVVVDSTGLPLALRYTATLVDPDADGIVEILAIDEAGNELRLADTIQGRTLRAVLPLYNFPATAPPTGRYDSVEVHNTGLLPIELTGVHFRGNVFFSAPLAQFPLVIPPQESRPIQVVFTPESDRLYADTVDILYHCATVPIALLARGNTPPRIVSTGCNVRITLSAQPGADRPELITGYPNPADEKAVLRLFAPAGRTLTIKMYTSLGTTAKEAEFTADAAGVYDVELATANLQNGVYIVVIQTAGTLLSHRLVISH